MIEVPFIMLDPRAKEPRNAYGNDAGHDLFALENTTLNEYGITDVRTGIAVAIPDGHYGRIVARSSTWRKKGVGVVEGIIDSGFRGELFCGAYMLHSIEMDANEVPWEVTPPTIKAGESIAQLIVQEVPRVSFLLVPELVGSERGEAGFGSSGA